MKVKYFPDTDTLYIDILDRSSVESEEVEDGVVFDYDAEGHIVGIEWEHASRRFPADKLKSGLLPIEPVIPG